MKLTARAKINLTLDILGKRPDGYHEVRMILQEIGLSDRITLEQGTSGENELFFSENGKSGGAAALSAEADNLMLRAARLMQKTFGISRGVRMRLEKNIPVAAGLAGGSADAAAVITGMDRLFGLCLSTEELCAAGACLGADIPFCIRGGTMLCEGIGERMTPAESRLHGFLVLAKPDAPVSTKDAYRAFDLLDPAAIERPDTAGALSALKNGDAAGLSASMKNVLEPVGISFVPGIRLLKERLMEEGAQAAMMSCMRSKRQENMVVRQTDIQYYI